MLADCKPEGKKEETGKEGGIRNPGMPETCGSVNCQRKHQSPKLRTIETQGLGFTPGNVLLSRAVSSAVASGLRGLTAVFGMGTGVTPSLGSPGKPDCQKVRAPG